MPVSILNSHLAAFQTKPPEPGQAKKEPTDNVSTRPPEQQALKKACAEMESVFIYHLLKEMRSTIPDSGLTGDNGSMKDIYNHMTDSQLARELSNSGGIGLSDILYRQLNRLTADAEKNHHEKID